MMNGPKIYSLIFAGMVAGFLAMPARADDYSPPSAPVYNSGANTVSASPQTMSAEQYQQPVIGQPTQSREPVYVWQGNRIPEPNSSTLGEPGLPHAKQVDNVRYITGGIGEEERDALNAVKNDYNLHITSTNSNGEFNGDTMVTVLDGKGQTLLNVNAGPLFYANLPAGTYIVKATTDGKTEERKVAVGATKASSVYFRW